MPAHPLINYDRSLRDPAKALSLAARAAELSHKEDPSILDTLALAYHSTGDLNRAIEVQQRAVDSLPATVDRLRFRLEVRLIEYLKEKGEGPKLDSTLEQMERFYRNRVDQRLAESAIEDSALASSLAPLGMVLIEREKHAEAQSILEKCLDIRRRVLTEHDWTIANTMSLLGAAFVGQGRWVEAERLLMDGYTALEERRLSIPEDVRDTRLQEALERIVRLFESWDAAEPGKGYAEKAAQWRAKLEETSKNQNVETSKP
jgi:tetratricopeptide (TPR) repeat protein